MRDSESWLAGCWLLGAQAAQENSMSSPECSQITWRERESAMAPGLRIQIPPGISLKDKPHTKKKTKSVNSKKIQPTSATEHCQEASCSASCCHLFCSLPLALVAETCNSDT